MSSDWINVFGLFLNIVGTIFLSFGLIINKEKALQLGMAKYGSSIKSENLKLPKVKELLKQSRSTAIGLSLIFVGFILQLIVSWPKN